MNVLPGFLIPLLTALASLIGLFTAVGKFSAKSRYKRRASYWRDESNRLDSEVSRERAAKEYKKSLGHILSLEQLTRFRILSTVAIGLGAAVPILLGVDEVFPSLTQMPNEPADLPNLRPIMPFLSIFSLMQGILIFSSQAIGRRVMVTSFVKDLEQPSLHFNLHRRWKFMMWVAVLSTGITSAVYSAAVTILSGFAKDSNYDVWLMGSFYLSGMILVLIGTAAVHRNIAFVTSKEIENLRPATPARIEASQKRSNQTFWAKWFREVVSGKSER